MTDAGLRALSTNSGPGGEGQSKCPGHRLQLWFEPSTSRGVLRANLSITIHRLACKANCTPGIARASSFDLLFAPLHWRQLLMERGTSERRGRTPIPCLVRRTSRLGFLIAAAGSSMYREPSARVRHPPPPPPQVFNYAATGRPVQRHGRRHCCITQTTQSPRGQ